MCQCVWYTSTDIHYSAGPWLHSILRMVPKQEVLKLLETHVHILHRIWKVHPVHTRRDYKHISYHMEVQIQSQQKDTK